MTREEADKAALRFLQDNGPHSMEAVLETDEAFAAAVIFVGLQDRGLARSTNLGSHIQWTITPVGKEALALLDGRAA